LNRRYHRAWQSLFHDGPASSILKASRGGKSADSGDFPDFYLPGLGDVYRMSIFRTFGVRRLVTALPRRDLSRRKRADKSAVEKAGASSRTPKIGIACPRERL